MKSETVVFTFAGIPLKLASTEKVAAQIVRHVEGGEPGQSVRLVNAYSLSLSRLNKDYKNLLCGPGWNLIDGAPLADVVMYLRGNTKESSVQVRGADLMRATIKESCQTSKVGHFFLGGTAETLEALMERLLKEWPEIQIRGMAAPNHSTLTESFLEECLELVGDLPPCSLIWVGLGTPKQDFIGFEISRKLRIPTINVGAAFNFLAGTISEAPAWVRRYRAEWLYRLFREPGRLWFRYFVGNSIFLGLAAREVMRKVFQR